MAYWLAYQPFYKETNMYEKKISRQNPGLIVALLDGSGSTADCLPGTSDAKCQWIERLFGIIFKELLARSTDVKGETIVIKPRYYVYVIPYGETPRAWGSGEMDIESALELYSQAGNSLGLKGDLGGTDSKAAMEMALEYLQRAVTQERFRDSFPPMVFHLTDGESQTDAENVAEQIKQLSTSDGNVLMVNAYIGSSTSLSYGGHEDFPGYVEVSEAGPDKDNIRMFNMSSEIPSCVHGNLIGDGIFPELREGARLFFDVRTKEMLKHVIQVVGSMGSRADRQNR
ncbi:MAG: hypothetical protein B6D36_17885 [Planctomycetes bacterium UTPLA1]|nr:MAG: hypothetical protein B6D36_17885 [Planctomycetes bacterium UTPLA1]